MHEQHETAHPGFQAITDDTTWCFLRTLQRRWMGSGSVDFNGSNPSNWDPKTLLDPKTAVLGPYTVNPGIYQCPSDWTVVNGREWVRFARIRSVAASQAVGTWYDGAPDLRLLAGFGSLEGRPATQAANGESIQKKRMSSRRPF
jgi:hypothetical protein